MRTAGHRPFFIWGTAMQIAYLWDLFVFALGIACGWAVVQGLAG